MSIEETVIEEYTNKGGFRLQVIAQLAGPGVGHVLYIIRLSDPQGNRVDFISDLESFSKLGELLLALHHFAKLKVVAKERDMSRLKELLTAANIKNFADILKASKGKL